MNNAPKKKYRPRRNKYINVKNKNITYILTRNTPSQTITIDTQDVKKVNIYSLYPLKT